MNGEAADRRLRYLLDRWNELDLQLLQIQDNSPYSMYSTDEAKIMAEIREEMDSISEEIEELNPPPPTDMYAGSEY